MKWSFFIDGLPVAQGRPRAMVTPGGHIRVYDPDRSRAWKNAVALASLPYKPRQPREKDIHVRVTFAFIAPKRLKNRLCHHIAKPDIDNLLKLCLDSLVGIFIRDDKQVICVEAEKVYGSSPGMNIEIEEVE